MTCDGSHILLCRVVCLFTNCTHWVGRKTWAKHAAAAAFRNCGARHTTEAADDFAALCVAPLRPALLALSPFAVRNLTHLSAPRMSVSKRVRMYTAEDVQQHATAQSCWVSHAGKVYDVTGFLSDHPGGDDLVLDYAGKDVGAIMKDSVSHDHSESAYDMFEEFCIGRIGEGEQIVDEGE
jgi:cytochrome b involved in lipid metabolism